MVTYNRSRVVVWWLLFAACGCEARVDRSLNGLSCSPDGACAEGYVCRDGNCVGEVTGSEEASRPDAQVTLTDDAASPASATHASQPAPNSDVRATTTTDSEGSTSSSTPGLGASSADAGGTSPSCTACASESADSKSTRSGAWDDARYDSTTNVGAATDVSASTNAGPTSIAAQDGGATCTSEACGSACPTGLTACSDGCYDLASDVNHCGLCDRACAGPQEAVIECRNRGCVVTCPDAQQVCGDECIDTKTDVRHCGTCDRACEAPDRSNVECVASECRFDCYDGYSRCGDECVDFLTDPLHCGDCTTECKGNKTCIDGSCRVK